MGFQFHRDLSFKCYILELTSFTKDAKNWLSITTWNSVVSLADLVKVKKENSEVVSFSNPSTAFFRSRRNFLSCRKMILTQFVIWNTIYSKLWVACSTFFEQLNKRCLINIILSFFPLSLPGRVGLTSTYWNVTCLV